MNIKISLAIIMPFLATLIIYWIFGGEFNRGNGLGYTVIAGIFFSFIITMITIEQLAYSNKADEIKQNAYNKLYQHTYENFRIISPPPRKK